MMMRTSLYYRSSHEASVQKQGFNHKQRKKKYIFHMIKEALSVAIRSYFYQQLLFFKPEKEDKEGKYTEKPFDR